MILVVGATGMLGGIITRRLLADGRKVRILVRPGSNYQPLVDAGAQPVTGDLKDRRSLDAACQGIETVVTTANSALRGGNDNPFTVEDQGNRDLIDAAKDAGVNHFIFISAVGADPDSPVPFTAGKGKAEQRLMQSGMPYTIIAPNAFAEIWFGIAILGPIARGLPVTLYEGGDGRTTFIAINDVASFAIAATDHPEAKNQKLIIGGPKAVSYPEAAALFQRVMGKGMDIVFVKPGENIPTIPEAVLPLYVYSSMQDTIIPTEELARAMGIRLTPPEEVVQNMLSAIPTSG